MGKRKKALIAGLVVLAVIVSAFSLNVFVMQKFIKTYTYTELEYRGYTAQDVRKIEIEHSYLDRLLGYDEWIISVEFKIVPDILFRFTYRDDKVIFQGVSSEPVLDKEEILYYSEKFKSGSLLRDQIFVYRSIIHHAAIHDRQTELLWSTLERVSPL